MTLTRCVNTDCWRDGYIYDTEEELVVRFRLGHVYYHKTGDVFRQEYALNQWGDKDAYTHIRCAGDAGVELEEMSSGKCHVCGHQFYCEVDPIECCVLIQVGKLEPEDFHEMHRGAVHWACVNEQWVPELWGQLRGE